jgi:undecaprenyl-diphosphatase
MTIFQAVFQGIVQGLTEFLPVSSSGHLSLIQYFTGQSGEAGALFTILLHLGTLLAVCLAFYKTILRLIAEVFAMLGDLFTGKFSLKKMPPYRRMVLLLLVSLLPMALSFVLLDFFDAVSADNSIIAEGFCFLVTSLLLFVTLRCNGRKTAKDMPYRDAAAIGAMQALAPLPGVSRSGSTIAVGLLCGLEREFAVSFSFIMGVPTVLGANLMNLGDIAGEGMAVSPAALVAGLLASLVFGLIAIRMVRWLVTSDKFKYFAWYTLILGAATVVIGLIERFAGHPLQGAVMGLLQ